ncbi:hypothetical protein SLEP1_g60528 [Rubroshorea leprosula]|uniref:Uncharacterized protein n=1 Tax=Rubroshorea leprosula TaxID=152421 RepID=A0AAV5MX74_9ROSI|nr:hypothetical protein SLEP1_g60528 [Rubroshorea leprosula]
MNTIIRISNGHEYSIYRVTSVVKVFFRFYTVSSMPLDL